MEKKDFLSDVTLDFLEEQDDMMDIRNDDLQMILEILLFILAKFLVLLLLVHL